MTFRDEFERELIVFFTHNQDMKVADQKAMLMLMFDKYVVRSESDTLLDYYDLSRIINDGKQSLSNESLPVTLAKGPDLSSQELIYFSVIQAFVGFINKKGALRRIPQFKRSK